MKHISFELSSDRHCEMEHEQNSDPIGFFDYSECWVLEMIY